MNLRVAKDIRLIAPPWLLTAALMIATTFLPHGGEWAVIIAVFGCLIVAASIFGAEFTHGTMSQLLAQPIDRRRIWRQKMLIRAAALGSLSLLMFSRERGTWGVAAVAACAFCTIPFFTLIGRNTVSGIILSIPIPGLIFVAGAAVTLWLLRPSLPDSAFNQERIHLWVRAYFGVLLPAYCIVVCYLGYRRFCTFEVVGRQQRQVRLPSSMQTDLDMCLSSLIPPKYRHVRSLVAKELHLQHNAVILFLIFAALQLLAIGYTNLADPEDREFWFSLPIIIYVITIPLVIGSSAIAEETNLGTRALNLTLPCSVRAQWLLKLSVVLMFTMLFAVAVPLFWFIIGWAIGLVPLESAPYPALLRLCCSVLFLTLMAFYASSFCRDTLRALLTAFGLCISIVMLIGLFQGALNLFQIRVIVGDGPLGDVLLFGLPLLCLLILLLRGSLKQFHAIHRGPLWTDMLAVVVCPIMLHFLVIFALFAG